MNKNKNIFLIVLVSLVILMIVPSISAEATNNEQKNEGKALGVPEHSRVVDLGNGLMRYDNVIRDNSAKLHKDDNPNKPVKPPKPDNPDKKSNLDYKLMGVSWKTAEPFQVNLGAFGVNEIQTSLNTWDSEVTFNVFGDGVSNPDAIRNLDKYPDNYNTVTFENLGDTGTIAFARTWYYRPPRREIVESDVVFNSYYTWSESGESDKMDLQNIATHEFGHSAGLLDLYEPGHSELTMYGYSGYGETKKQSLEAGDIAGIHAIYGS